MQKTKSSKEVYQGVIFNITSDEVEIKGNVYRRDVVHHSGGVGILAIRQNQVLLVSQYRYAIQKSTYEIPAGKLEQGEDPYTCGMRELEEESGYTTKTLHSLCELYSTPGFCNEKIYLYWTNQLQKVEHPLHMDEDEEIEIAWYTIDEALKMVHTGVIQDAKTMIAIQFAKLTLDHQSDT